MAAHQEGAERLAETWKPARRKRNHEQMKDHLSLALCQREQQISSLSQQATEADLIGFFFRQRVSEFETTIHNFQCLGWVGGLLQGHELRCVCRDFCSPQPALCCGPPFSAFILCWEQIGQVKRRCGFQDTSRDDSSSPELEVLWWKGAMQCSCCSPHPPSPPSTLLPPPPPSTPLPLPSGDGSRLNVSLWD